MNLIPFVNEEIIPIKMYNATKRLRYAPPEIPLLTAVAVSLRKETLCLLACRFPLGAF